MRNIAIPLLSRAEGDPTGRIGEPERADIVVFIERVELMQSVSDTAGKIVYLIADPTPSVGIFVQQKVVKVSRAEIP